jgi:hypothetical protein
MLVFVAAITAQFVIACAVVDVGKGDVARLVALVLAVEARKSWRRIDVFASKAWGLRWREGREVRARRGAWLVGAVRAVAVVVVQACNGKFDSRIRDASKCLGILVVLCNYKPAVSIIST